MNNTYTVRGDVYQVGVILFQLLGGRLLYSEVDWLTKKERQEYDALDYPENTVFADLCLLDRIRRGKLLDFDTLPAWTSDQLKRIVRKATHLNPAKRYASAAEFLARLAEARASVKDWVFEDGCLTLSGPTSYRVVEENSLYRVQKRKTSPEWRNDNTQAPTDDLRQLVRDIEKCV